MKAFRVHLLFLLALFVGCAQLGLTQAKTFEDKLAYAVGIHTAVQYSTAQSLTAHAITSDEAGQVLKMADNSRLILDAAKQAAALGDMAAANAKLVLAQSALTALQTYLTERSQKHG